MRSLALSGIALYDEVNQGQSKRRAGNCGAIDDAKGRAVSAVKGYT